MGAGPWGYEPYSEDVAARLYEQLKGVTVANATPLDENEQLDVEGLECLIERLIDAGVCSIFPMGWCGEGPPLSDAVRKDVLRESCRIVDGRVPVMAAVSEQSLGRTLELAIVARDAGADMILTPPPYSYEIPQSLIYDYFKNLADQSGVPVILYQNDEVKVGLSMETVERLSEIPGIVGTKVYAPSFSAFTREHRTIQKEGRFCVFCADDNGFASAMGMGVEHLMVGGPGNVSIRWCMDMHERAGRGEWDAVREKQLRMDAFFDAAYAPATTPYVTVKYLLSKQGVCSDRISSPMRTLLPEERRAVDEVVDQYPDILDPHVEEFHLATAARA